MPSSVTTGVGSFCVMLRKPAQSFPVTTQQASLAVSACGFAKSERVKRKTYTKPALEIITRATSAAPDSAE